MTGPFRVHHPVSVIVFVTFGIADDMYHRYILLEHSKSVKPASINSLNSSVSRGKTSKDSDVKYLFQDFNTFIDE